MAIRSLRPVLLPALVALLSVAAGAQAGSRPPDPEVVLDKAASACARSPSAVSFADSGTRYRACFDGATPSVVVERRPRGGARYHFANGQLAHARLTAAPAQAGGGPGADAASVPVLIDWNSEGTAVRAVRREHYGEVRLDATAVEGIRGRGQALAAAAVAARGTP